MKKFDLKITFTDRESYLAWRKQWAADYAEISQTITDLKFYRKTKLTEAQEARQEEIRNRKHLHGDYGFNPAGCLWRYQDTARIYMGLMDAAKRVATQQWEALHPELAKAAQEQREKDAIAKEKRIAEKIEKNRQEREARRSKPQADAQTSAA